MPRARRAELAARAERELRACGSVRRPGWALGEGTRARAPSSSPGRSTSLPICTTRGRTEPCPRPGEALAVFAFAPRDSCGDRRHHRSLRAHNREAHPMTLARRLNSTFSGVHDFFNSGTWLVIRNLGIFFVVVFWRRVAFWVYKDARRRIRGRCWSRPRRCSDRDAVLGRDRVHALPAAGIPRGRARARTRDQGDGGAPQPPRPPVPCVPVRPSSSRSWLARCRAAEAGVCELQRAAGGVVGWSALPAKFQVK